MCLWPPHSTTARGAAVTIYFHHVGEVGAARDFPRTIHTEIDPSTVRHFGADDILPQLTDLPEDEVLRVATALRSVPQGVQVWGIPSGGARLFRRVNESDFWLLIDTDRPGGTISYAGRIVCKVENPSHELSNYLWGEAKFPLILLLGGFCTELEVTQFKELFGYSPNWSMRGLSYPLAQQRIEGSQFGSESAFIAYLRTLSDNTSANALPELDEPPPDEYVLEGGLALSIHLSRERDRTIVAKFKASLKSLECCVCSFDFGKVYGKVGEGFIEAHHERHLSSGERRTRIADLHPVCSNCHRMLHRNLGISIETLRELMNRS